MAKEYLIPGGGIYNDTEQGFEPLVPGVGIVQEELSAVGPTQKSISGILPAMGGVLSRKLSLNRSLTGDI